MTATWLNHLRQAQQCLTRKEWDAAAQLSRKALASKPDCALAQQILGLIAFENGQVDEAMAHLSGALSIRPDLVPAHNTLGRCHLLMGRLEEAEACFNRVLFFQPGHPYAHFSRAAIWLKRGQYRQGWLEYEWRWPCGSVRRPSIQRPRWDGSPLNGRSILVHTEQGRGDVIQFIRFLPLLKQQCGRLVFACQTPLHALLRPTKCIDSWFPIDQPAPIEFDVHAPLLSLPALLDVDSRTIPMQTPYIFPDPKRAAAWREQLSKANGQAVRPNASDRPRLKVGLCWQGSPTFEGDRFRSIPLSEFIPLAQIPGISFVSMQTDAGVEQIKDVRQALPLQVFNDLDHEAAFVDRAAILSHLDLLITSDTSIAHVAGAMGRPVWLLLSTASDWRWLQYRSDSPWYLNMRIFRQKKLTDWPCVFREVAQALHKLVAGP